MFYRFLENDSRYVREYLEHINANTTFILPNNG